MNLTYHLVIVFTSLLYYNVDMSTNKMQSFRFDEATRTKLEMIVAYLFTNGKLSNKKKTEALEYLIDNFELDDTEQEA